MQFIIDTKLTVQCDSNDDNEDNSNNNNHNDNNNDPEADDDIPTLASARLYNALIFSLSNCRT